MAEREAWFRPSVERIREHTHALSAAATMARRSFELDRSACLLLGCDEPEVDRALSAYAERIDEPRMPGGAMLRREALDIALQHHGAARMTTICAAMGRTLPLAWFAPAPSETATLFELLRALRHAREPTAFRVGLTLAMAECARRAAPPLVAELSRDLDAPTWLERAAIARARGELGIAEWVDAEPPAWLPRAHPIELRDELTQTLARRALAGEHGLAPGFRGDWDRLPCPTRALVMIDVDRMKRVNDVYSLPAGDRLLRALVDRLHQLVGDRVVRFGGDIFVVAWEGSAPHDLARRLVDDLRDLHVPAPFGPAERIPVTVSAGSAEGERLGETLRRTEEALHRAKRGGRDRAEGAD